MGGGQNLPDAKFFWGRGGPLEYLHAGPLQPCYATAIYPPSLRPCLLMVRACVQEEEDVVARSEFILDHMQRRASLDMAFFCQALDDTSQTHVVDGLFRQLHPTAQSST